VLRRFTHAPGLRPTVEPPTSTFGQELFEISESTSGDLTDPVYLDARAFMLASAGANGIDAAMSRDSLDAIIAPSYSFASTPAAVAGYPNIAVPVGLTPEGKPAGIWMYSGFLREPRLLALAYDLEQAIRPRREPEMLGADDASSRDRQAPEALTRGRAVVASASLQFSPFSTASGSRLSAHSY
jgi:hypothetical protein